MRGQQKTVAWILGVALVATGAVAATPTETVAVRQAGFKQIGRANKAIMDELKKPDPSIALILSNAKALEGLAKQQPSWFRAGSGPEAGVKTAALPSVWAQKSEFRQAMQRFYGATRVLNRAASSGNVEQTRTAAAAVGAQCKACHQSFRGKD